jgi:hypothetical protein
VAFYSEKRAYGRGNEFLAWPERRTMMFAEL